MLSEDESYSVVEFFGAHDNYECGYCKGASSSQSHGMWAHKMSTDDYQNLIDRGWRRCGKYCYKPNMETTCCPSYTIRCEAKNFKLSKSQKKIIKRFNRFLMDGIADKEANILDGAAASAVCELIGDTRNDGNYQAKCSDIPDIDMKKISKNLSSFNHHSKPQDNFQQDKPMVCRPVEKTVKCNKLNEDAEKKNINQIQPNKIAGADPLKPPRKKAKLLRLERKAAKQCEINLNRDDLAGCSNDNQIDNKIVKQKPVKNIEKTLSMFLSESPINGRHRLNIKLVPSKKASIPDEFNVYRKYQVTIHKDKPESLTQISFENFLVRSPLEYSTDSNGIEYGSFHQQYWLDNKLIAVGVIDILPHSVSSVYFFYDPDYSFLTLGTYASLREIDFVNKLSLKSSRLCYYYMGFYIHSCPKMIYKAKIQPSYLLCPEVYTWHILTEEIQKKLDEKKNQRLNVNMEANDIDLFASNDLDTIKILFDFEYFERFKRYKERHPGVLDTEKYFLYGTLVGRTLSNKMILCN